MKRIDEVLEKTLLQFGRGNTPEQCQRNQRNIVSLRKMIDAVKISEAIEKEQKSSTRRDNDDGKQITVGNC
ncbi:TPA: hypothetical protein JAW23_004001 [Citrobacter koseri]|uniref:hypothetical protein n=1 Tax=Citrobacter TaxID=544 RepID=UPI0018FF3435|nr:MULTISPECIES: hypothetical protein [Citrobacter]EMD6816015.1 hypothetical protein [Citrobacter koseri]MBJ8937132.1 hypothetical protein [Citrobacter koseri]MBJ9108640.1 hypothetical protein [Citrobacter koseri]MBJ9818030.1 hypothetical protein [Citrobacter koseri]MDM2947308.1 hypothetical protein [Citrobacter sp. CK207]